MARKLTAAQLDAQKKKALNSISNYLDHLISKDEKQQSRADKLCYWLNDYMKFLEYEDKFDPTRLKKYDRGDIVRVHLGYNIGSEQGGLHYAVVIQDNARLSPVVTIVPLTSIKPTKDLEHLRPGEIFMGDELYSCVHQKLAKKLEIASQYGISVNSRLDEMLVNVDVFNSTEFTTVQKDMDFWDSTIEECNRILSTFKVMKSGSIALVNQITTVSKIRIYDPKHISDVLGGIRMSNEILDLIDKEIIKLYTKPEVKAVQNT